MSETLCVQCHRCSAEADQSDSRADIDRDRSILLNMLEEHDLLHLRQFRPLNPNFVPDR